MAYNRYRGNSGRVERIEDPVSPPPVTDVSPASLFTDASPLPPPPREEAAERPRPPFAPPPPGAGVLPGLGEGFIRRLLRALSPGGLETEDLLLMAILYLLYRETGDRDFLIMLGGILFL